MLWTIFWQTLAIIALIILLTRLHGLRSFSKMSGFDFAITVAFGSVLASAATTPDSTVLIPAMALGSLFLAQTVLSRLRVGSDAAQQALDNAPVLVMRGKDVDDDALNKAGMTRSDLWGKLREANAYDLETVLAVVVEPTGDVSVLHGDGNFEDISPEVLEGVRGS